MNDIDDALHTALNLEEKGYQVYTEAAKKTLNKLGKHTFEAIALKELDHIKAIKEYSKNINLAIEDIHPKSKIDYIKPIIEKLKSEVNEKAAPDADLEKAYKAALGLEKDSYNLYKKLAGQSQDPKAKKFFEFLMGEENTHYELLSETLEYLNRTGDWYREKERWIVEGG